MGEQFLVVYLDNNNEEESKKFMQVFMKEVFPNTAKGCKWRSSTTKRTHFQFEVTPASTQLQVDLFCLNESDSAEMVTSEFQADDGAHRPLNVKCLRGFIIVGRVEDPKKKEFKVLRDQVITQADHYRKAKGLGPKDVDFIVGVVNTIPEFDSKILEKKLKEKKLTDPSKTFYANSAGSLMTKLVDIVKK
jgi:hypothetical protein